jgi:hypothetical protein
LTMSSKHCGNGTDFKEKNQVKYFWKLEIILHSSLVLSKSTLKLMRSKTGWPPKINSQSLNKICEYIKLYNLRREKHFMIFIPK